MIDFKTTKEIADKDLRHLYEASHWISYTNKFPEMSILLKDCMLVYSAWNKDKLVGLIRVIGDNHSIAYVQDLLVLPDYQGKGIGHELLRHIIEEAGHIRQLVLITDSGKENQSIRDWYERQGLKAFEQMNLAGYYLQRN